MNFLKIILILFTVSFYVSNCFGQDGYVSGAPRLAYWKLGRGSDIVIVLHGGPAAGHNYLRPEWDRLSKKAQVVYYDQRGCGKSEKATCYGWREQVSDLRRLIQTLASGHKVTLAGSSWGYQLALLYAYTHPEDVKALILSGTYNWEGKGQPIMKCSAYLPEKGKDTLDWHGIFPLTSGPEKISLKESRLIEHHEYIRGNIQNSKQEAPTLEQLNVIQVPVLIFESASCTSNWRHLKGNAQVFRGILPHVEIYSIEGEGVCHDPWYTHPNQFFQKCLSFLAENK